MRWNRNFYFTKFSAAYGIANIVRVMECCESNPEPSACEYPFLNMLSCGRPDETYLLNVEVGSIYQQVEVFPYAALGISK
ncbi:MAG: hypothetical protein HRT71_07395 [Flavobacteriales bacterium]|nr:hypothetical protein [Flavobacteriales bacterium]